MLLWARHWLFSNLSYYHWKSDESLVLNQTKKKFIGQLNSTAVFLLLAFSVSGRQNLFSNSIKLSEVNDYSTDGGKDIYSTFDSETENDEGLPLDPFALMNRLKRAGEMDNATTPSDAIDEALNAFDQSGYENVPIK